jgi:hypothetical protein
MCKVQAQCEKRTFDQRTHVLLAAREKLKYEP